MVGCNGGEKKEKIEIFVCMITSFPVYSILFLFNPDYVIEFVMSVAIARKSGCLEILA
jgi:hypothetical protein